MLPFYESRCHDLEIQPLHAFHYPVHLHAHVELIYLFDGSIRMAIDGQDYLLTAGDLALCFPNTLHGFDESGPARGLKLVFLPEISADYGRQLRQMRTCAPVLRADRLAPSAHAIFHAVETERSGCANPAIYSAYIQIILTHALPLLPLVPHQFFQCGDTLVRALNHISAHYAEPLTLEELARQVGVSSYHLSRLINDRLHMSFRRYLNSLRINKARNLLRSTDMPIIEIMYGCGFSCQRTFYRAFLEETGSTPSKYRLEGSPPTPPPNFCTGRTIDNQNIIVSR